MGEEALTIRQAAALLGCHPNTVRNRIKAGTIQADKVLTNQGETYLIPRSELAPASTTNSLVSSPPSQEPSQPLPDVREAMRAMLEPFVEELGAVREELGREKERREQLERERDELRRELEALREARESDVGPGPSEAPTPAPADAQAAPQRPQTVEEAPERAIGLLRAELARVREQTASERPQASRSLWSRLFGR